MKLSLLTFTSVLAIGAGAVAEPTLYPQTIGVLSRITNNTDSNILADDTDPSTIWVLPPNVATATVSNLRSLNGNMALCGEMVDLKAYSREAMADINGVEKDLVKRKIALAAKIDHADKLLEDAEKFAADSHLQALDDLDNRLADLKTQIDDTYKQKDACSSNCDQVLRDLSDLLAARKDLMKQRSDLIKQNTADQREYLRRRKTAEAAKAAYSSDIQAYMELNNAFFSMHQKYIDTFHSFGEMPAGEATIDYASTFDTNIEKLRADNPGVNFSKISTKNAVLMAVAKSAGGLGVESAVQNIQIGDKQEKGAAHLDAYPPSFSATVGLSLLSACPIQNPAAFDLTPDSATIAKYGLIITYDYDTVFRMKAEATYNMYKMYQKIVTGGSSGGFFSSHSWSNVEETNFFRDSFVVKWSDQENTLTAEQKDAAEQEMRHNVMMRLANLALPDTQARADIVAAMPAPERGAAVVSDSLMNTCPGNIYCVGAAAVFKVLDAIWGHSSSSASYTNIKDFQITDNYERDQKITKSWVTSYK